MMTFCTALITGFGFTLGAIAAAFVLILIMWILS